MALDPADLQAIADIVDRRIQAQAEIERAALRRRRRRTWLIIAIVAALWLALAAWGAWKASERIQDYVVRQDEQVERMRENYAQLLAQNEQLRKERETVAAAVRYDPKQSQAAHEANLVATTIRLLGQQKSLAMKLENLDGSDPEQLEAATQELGAVFSVATDALTSILLRNTDPDRPSRPGNAAREADGATRSTTTTGARIK